MKQFKYLSNKKKLELFKKVRDDITSAPGWEFICQVLELRYKYKITSVYIIKLAKKYGILNLIEDYWLLQVEQHKKMNPPLWHYEEDRLAFLDALIKKMEDEL